jgi:hypothetical protein
MPFPTDRGYVTITDLDDGGKRVEVYARMGRAGPTHMFARYGWCREVLVETDTPFVPWEAGSVSDDVVEVNYDLATGQLAVRDPAEMPDPLGPAQ